MYKEALELEREIGNESMQAVCLNNIGSVYSEKGQYEDALTYLQQVLQLREKSKVPQDIVDALHNLGQALTSMGEYDQAISYYMKALELRRSINDTRGWMGEILGGYGQALILAGRIDEAKSPLEEALSLARELKNDGLVAQTIGFRGDAFFYKGNFSAAHTLYDQALQAAIRSKETERILLAKIALAKVTVREKKGSAVIPSLRALMQQADEGGLKYSAVECSVFMAEAMLQARDAAHAGQELGRALLRSDKLGQQALSAQAHYLLGTIGRDSKDNGEARDHFRWVVNILDTMKKDQGAENLLLRADMKLMYEDAAHWLKASGN
jgi:tetratricopeptide (TPR) repeat protein